MKSKVYFRADGNSQLGLGHIYRSIAVAEMIKDNFECTFGSRGPLDITNRLFAEHNFQSILLPSHRAYNAEARHLGSSLRGYDLIVLDGYAFDTEYQQLLIDAGVVVVSIDDISPYHFVSHCVINHGPVADRLNYSREPYTQLYLGAKYALLREPFASSKPKTEVPESLKRVFISFGGADPNNLTLKALAAAWSTTMFDCITVVTGGAYQHLEELRIFASDRQGIRLLNNVNASILYQEMSEADLAIVPSSTMLFELLTTGTLALTGYYVDNQKYIYEGFEAERITLGIGNLNSYTIDELATRIKKELSDHNTIHQIPSRSSKIFDGQAKHRIARIFESLMSK